mmetsp:Transcript_28010/g.73949  ORF Transcript_28010/g.73949 Transcript_28010/m.73949 type:complete len:205 (+) Transcript_28010:750-1364(+)
MLHLASLVDDLEHPRTCRTCEVHESVTLVHHCLRVNRQVQEVVLPKKPDVVDFGKQHSLCVLVGKISHHHCVHICPRKRRDSYLLVWPVSAHDAVLPSSPHLAHLRVVVVACLTVQTATLESPVGIGTWPHMFRTTQGERWVHHMYTIRSHGIIIEKPISSCFIRAGHGAARHHPRHLRRLMLQLSPGVKPIAMNTRQARRHLP